MARARSEIFACALITLLTSPMAVADTFVHAKVEPSGAVTPTCFNTTVVPNQGIGTGCEIEGDSGFAPVVGSAFAYANGVDFLGTSARLSSSNSDGGSWEAIGFAEGTDTLRISAPGLAGTQGAADFIFTTHTADERDNGSLLDGTMSVISEMQVKSDGNIRLIHSLSFPRTLPPYAARVFFVYGEPFELTVSLESKVTCSLAQAVGMASPTQAIRPHSRSSRSRASRRKSFWRRAFSVIHTPTWSRSQSRPWLC